MFRLFSKFRKRLISESNLGAYLKYAFGEIILVVVGILLALQINTWNLDRQTRNTEQVYLSEIRNNLVSDTLRIGVVLKFNQEKIEVVNGLMGIFADTLSNEERFELIDLYTIPFTNYEAFVPKQTTWNNLLESESVGIIEDSELRKALIEYYSYDYNGSVQERIKIMNRKIIDEYFPDFFTKEYTLRNLGISTNMPGTTDFDLHLNQGFLSDLFGASYLVSLQDQFMLSTKEQVDSLLAKIDSNLEE